MTTVSLRLPDELMKEADKRARELKVPSPLIQLTADLMRVAHNALGEEADHVEAVKVLELWAGQEIE